MDIEQINLQKIASDSSTSAIVKVTAMKLMENPYLTVGDFFKSLTSNDLACLQLMVENIQESEQSQFDIVCLTEMLTRAEGTETFDIAAQTKNVNFFCNLVLLCSLERKGLVEISFENLSFGDDMADVKIVKLKDNLDEEE